jgi:hypothetical protein
MDGQDFHLKETKKKGSRIDSLFLFGGDGEIRTRVLLTLTINAYTFRSRFFIPSEIDGSYFDIVTNNCVEFTCNKVAL